MEEGKGRNGATSDWHQAVLSENEKGLEGLELCFTLWAP